MPSAPEVWDIIRNGNLALLMITWSGRLVIVGGGGAALLLAGLWLRWLYGQLRRQPRVAVFILCVMVLIVAWPVYRLRIVHAPLVIFGEVISLLDSQIYLLSMAIGFVVGLLLWGIYDMLRSWRRAILACLMVALMIGLWDASGKPFDLASYSWVAVAGLLLALLLWGFFRLLSWLWRKLF